MKIKDIAGFRSLEAFVSDKTERFGSNEKNFKVLFDFMFEQSENIIAETSNGFRINKITYGESKRNAETLARKLKSVLSDVEDGAVVGLFMANGLEWIETFWAILACGFNPLLLNSRLPESQIEKTLEDARVAAVISDSKTFSVRTVMYSDVVVLNEEKPTENWGERVYFMSSGTTGNVKLCAYTAENFYYQISNSREIVETCPRIKDNFEGHIKLLALLPFYHVFGFVAVYMWFGFYARTFVFLKDLNAQTLLHTVKKHKVTHVFAVPMVWETVYKQAMKTIRSRGEETETKFLKAQEFVNKHQVLGGFLSKFAFKEIRENLFGESIRFLISGGSAISKEAITFLNSIGYVTVNGYGMTELAITSVEMSAKRKERNLASIGAPFGCAEYMVSEKGELFVKSKARASEIICGDKVEKTDFDQWFNTNDMAEVRDGKFYLTGRKDDLIITSSGENINPQTVEDLIKVEGVNNKCLIQNENGAVLILELDGYKTHEMLVKIEEDVKENLREANVLTEVKNIVLTRTNLMDKDDFKISRTKIAKKYADGKIVACAMEKKTEAGECNEVEKELVEILKGVVDENLSVSVDDDFFLTLNISSLEYYQFMYIVRDRFNLKQDFFKDEQLSTISQFASAILQGLR